MITLATLPTTTPQQVFDQVVTHLRKQGVPSNVRGRCLYRGPEGMKCAAGCLIGDDEYNPMLDSDTTFSSTNWATLVDKDVVPSNHKSLIIDLQHVHDCFEPGQWEDQFERLANEHDLVVPPAA